uniref:Uncharacterized protein n=1 Tax=Davidia involucrata TaxID=16924 RepID=A0A5B7C220_DAVIN
MGSSSNKTQMQQSRGHRVVLFPVPLQGHINPMLQLGNILHSKGFSITVIHTKFNSPNQSKYPHFTFQPIPDGLSENQAVVSSLFTVLNINCVAPFRDCMTRLLEEPIACLITDALWHFTQAVADSLGLPRIVLRTSSLSSFLAFAAFPLLRKNGYLPKQGAFLALLCIPNYLESESCFAIWSAAICYCCSDDISFHVNGIGLPIVENGRKRAPCSIRIFTKVN